MIGNAKHTDLYIQIFQRKVASTNDMKIKCRAGAEGRKYKRKMADTMSVPS